ncbi:hypothetical protein [Burkholderia metallica]|uniref:hypothetical protein n=1 Tax=Burkholderia metallica TaxID=488729 RepID=UPI0008421929|nr:hypothetical protein [Burkholderia metallica]AOJ31394.1 hypothetical protein WJ16_07665 [Burkholderia metallica]
MSTNENGDDLLDMEFINSLPQPLLARQYGSGDRWWWPVNDIDVQTGLLRIDVCGKLDVLHISDVYFFRDANGNEYHSDDFYSDSDRAELAKKA